MLCCYLLWEPTSSSCDEWGIYRRLPLYLLLLLLLLSIIFTATKQRTYLSVVSSSIATSSSTKLAANNTTKISQYDDADTIIRRSYNQSYAHILPCEDNPSWMKGRETTNIAKDCIQKTREYIISEKPRCRCPEPTLFLNHEQEAFWRSWLLLACRLLKVYKEQRPTPKLLLYYLRLRLSFLSILSRPHHVLLANKSHQKQPLAKKRIFRVYLSSWGGCSTIGYTLIQQNRKCCNLSLSLESVISRIPSRGDQSSVNFLITKQPRDDPQCYLL